MGDEVSKDHFSAKEFELFQLKLDQEMDFVRQLFAEDNFDNQSRSFGYELELCLLDKLGHPAPCNQQILDHANNPLFTYELAKFNLEINGNCFVLAPDLFNRIDNDLKGLFEQVQQAAEQYNIHAGMFGVLPSLFEEHLDPMAYMSHMHRYQVLNDRLMSMRNRPIHLDIRGEEHLQIEKNDVMLEAMGTSLQIHLQVPYKEAVDFYHASLWASMAMVAVSANSPLVLGKSCWQESRIAIFKQSVDTRNAKEVHDAIIPRVHFGKGYIQSWLELFEDNNYYSPILPEVMDTEVDKLHHFNLHNGTIWRWVRPILGRNDNGQFHLRLELRVAPSGPTLIDTMANIVFYIGLTEGLKQTPKDLTRIPYEVLEKDFYKVARHGFETPVNWCHGEKLDMRQLLLKSAIPVAREGLQQLRLNDYEAWIEIIEQRVSVGQTGSDWILGYWHKQPDAAALVRAYLDNASRNEPVHTWPKP